MNKRILFLLVSLSAITANALLMAPRSTKVVYETSSRKAFFDGEGSFIVINNLTNEILCKDCEYKFDYSGKVKFSPEGEFFAIIPEAGYSKVYKTTGQQILMLGAWPAKSFVFAPQGGFCCAVINGVVKFWDLQTSEEVSIPNLSYKDRFFRADVLSISPDGKFLAVKYFDSNPSCMSYQLGAGCVAVWSLHEERFVFNSCTELDRPIDFFEFSPNGKFLLLSNGIWSIPSKFSRGDWIHWDKERPLLCLNLETMQCKKISFDTQGIISAVVENFLWHKGGKKAAINIRYPKGLAPVTISLQG